MIEYGRVKVRVETMVPLLVLGKIEDFQNRWKLPDRSAAIVQLCNTALFIEDKLPLAQKWTNKDIEEIRTQLEEGQLVDYLAELPRDKFSLIYDIVTEEQKIRVRKR